ncbi:uncharacterized protein E0L32_011735 [Thyridium curvatum]|uniref:Enoyl reductase (ER) domain-containing protein n=1 Tax=Thyridium curvatum TaxID=1093900 RepID=A0A507BNM8_9PEZI|nr:uncharacterized protein E0L32_011735 [Thyridium curvatum]TPX18360.1 hypothetical protein E0L32_011735 [Thyridium curvatum]
MPKSPAAMTTMRAFVTDGKKSGSVRDVDRPRPRPGQVLIKVHNAALNPGDWKLVEGNVASDGAPEGLVVGFDFAGTVVQGPGWPRGQRVGGWTFGTNEGDTQRGAFAEYVTLEPSLLFPVPDNITMAQASTVSLGYATATLALYFTLGLPEPYQGGGGGQQSLLVYGASSSVGLYAVQLGRLSGQRVIAVASAKNHGLLKELGADITVDYRDEDWVARVKEATQGGLRYAFDCIGQGGSAESIAEILSPSDGAHLVALNPLDKDAICAINPHIKAESIFAGACFGEPIDFIKAFDNIGGPTPEHKKAWETYLSWLPAMLQKGDIVPNRVKEMGTLESVLEAFELSKAGKLSAEKAVFQVSM